MSNFEERFNKATTKEFLNNLKTDIERKRDELESLKEKVFNFVIVVLVILILSFILFLFLSRKEVVYFLIDQLSFLDNVRGGR